MAWPYHDGHHHQRTSRARLYKSPDRTEQTQETKRGQERPSLSQPVASFMASSRIYHSSTRLVPCSTGTRQYKIKTIIHIIEILFKNSYANFRNMFHHRVVQHILYTANLLVFFFCFLVHSLQFWKYLLL